MDVTEKLPFCDFAKTGQVNETQIMRILLLLLVAVAVKGQWWHNMPYGRHTMVHLFEWKWNDIADECERFLAPNGYGGVQVSPPNEHIKQWSPFRPWWERYQPVSYQLISRSGSDAEFRDMVDRCNNVGVNIYVDAVINHMAAAATGDSTAGSFFDPGNHDFPAVPFSEWDFNSYYSGRCTSSSGGIDNYGDIDQVRNCDLVGLPDLYLEKEYVRGKIVEYLNTLIDIGVAGFRVDAVKHMWPGDLQNIFGRLNNLNTKYFASNSRSFVAQEVIDTSGSEPIKSSDYNHLGRVTEFKYGIKLADCVLGYDQMKYLYNFGEAWGMLNTNDALVFIDNHDNQRSHGGGGNVITYTSPREYKIASAFMLAWDYGVTRVMSSYSFSDSDESPPSDGSGNTNSPTINGDGSCGGGWVCEHRWRQINNMVGFRNIVSGQSVANWWDNGNQAIAFSRGNKGFIVINNESSDLGTWLTTGLPAGTYCDIISGDKVGSSCTGKTITVYSDTTAYFDVKLYNSGTDTDPIVAIHVDAKV